MLTQKQNNLLAFAAPLGVTISNITDYQNKDSKYRGQYMYKIGFGGNIIEYPPTLLLIINKPIYNTYTQIKKLKSALKK